MRYFDCFDLAGSAARSGSGSDGRQAVGDHHNLNIGDQMEIQRLSNIQISKDAAAASRYPRTGYTLVPHLKFGLLSYTLVSPSP